MTDVGPNALMRARAAPVARPVQNPATRFNADAPMPNTLTGPRLPANSLQMPPPMAPVVPQIMAAQPPAAPPGPSPDEVGPPREAPPPNIAAIRAAHPHVGMANMPDEQAAEAFKQHGHNNVLALWKAVRRAPWFEEAVSRARDGNREAHSLAAEHDISPRQAAAVMANIPGRAADMLETVKNEKNRPFDEAMRTFVERRMDNRANDKLREHGHRLVDAVPRDAKLKDLDEPMHKAMFIRAHDELEGKERWGSFHPLAQAAKALKSDSLENIKESLGLHHETRARYNTIVAPDGDHVVIDRHAIEAAHMMPHAAKRGDDALHGLYGDIYRRAANTVSQYERRKYTPNEVHGVVSEAVKGLFDKPEHYGTDAEGEPTHPAGQAAKYFHTLARHHAVLAPGSGVMTREMARLATLRAAGGISPPSWWRR